MSEETAPLVNFSGDLISLGPLQRDLIPTYQRWNNDPSTSQTRGLSWPTTLEQETAMYDQRVNDSSAIYFTIYYRPTERPIGIAYLYDLDYRHARAGYGIIIGEPEDRGLGFGTEATRLVLDYAFNACGLENVMLTVAAFNHAGVHAYEKAGFTTFGRRRRCTRFGNQLHDLVYMECISADHESAGISRFLYDKDKTTAEQ